MSATSVFAFVEGTSDRFFYDRLLQSSLRTTSLTHEIRIAQELPGSTGGKEALRVFYRYLRRRRQLFIDFKGKVGASIFFMDKDVDDVTMQRCQSEHVCYTEYYETENYLFRYGDLIQAVSATAGITASSAIKAIGDVKLFLTDSASTWKEWVKLCVLARMANTRSIVSYSVPSRINANLTGVLNQAALDAALADLKTEIGPDSFSKTQGRANDHVEAAYAKGNADHFFKGKWYVHFAKARVHESLAGAPYDSNGFDHRLLSSLALTLDFDQDWAGVLKFRVARVISTL